MKRKIVAVLAVSMLILPSCGGNDSSSESADQKGGDTTAQVEDLEEKSTITGSYKLTDMVPVTDGKELTKQDETYINDSKKRTIGNTTLTLNEDGTFERVFPHPSGNGKMNTWTGTYELNEDGSTLNMIAEMNGKQMPINFTIEEQTANQLSLKTDFGQIFMTYVYSK